MKITVTAREILDRGCWDEFCQAYGISVWAMNEGLMDDDEEFKITLKQAKRWGLFKEEDLND